MLRRLYKILLAALLLSACGDPLVDGDYRGEPLLRVEGSFVLLNDLAAKDLDALGRLQVSLFWLASLQPSANNVAFTAQAGSVAQGLASPARYAFDLYLPPDDAVLVTMPDSDQEVGMAVVLLFDDLNGDGLRQEGEAFVGGTQNLLLLYTPTALDSDLIDTTLAPGFHLLAGTTQSPDPLNAPSSCLTDSSIAAFTRIGATNQVDLTLDFIDDPWQRVPDINCDGSITEWCEQVRPFLDPAFLPTPERLIEQICYTPAPEREQLLEAYSLCQSQFKETDACLPDFSRCDDLSFSQPPPWPPDHPIVDYYLCRHPELDRDGCRELFGFIQPEAILYDPVSMVLRACMEPREPGAFQNFADAYRRCFADPCFTDEFVNACPSAMPEQPPASDPTSLYLDCAGQNPPGPPPPDKTQP